MATTNYAWVISSMDSYPIDAEGLTDVICVVHWRRTATQVDGDKTYFADVYSTLSVPSPDPADFVPYDQVTEAVVDSWLTEGLDVESLDANLDTQIENQINPPIITLPLPWLPSENSGQVL
jgi:hypothetical protein